MKLFKMGDMDEGQKIVDAYITLTWYEKVTDIPPGIYLQTVFLSFAFPWLGKDYDINSRKLRYGWWMHWVCLYREDRWPIPHVGLFKSKYFDKEKVSVNKTGTGKLQTARRPDSKPLLRSQSDYGT